MKEITVQDFNDNFFSKISKEWMIVSAGEADSYNMMTASWGGIGWLWNKPVAFVFIRPERHTFGLTEKLDRMTLSFLGNSETARQIYKYCGSKSGKTADKMHESGLTLKCVEQGALVYDQAQLTLACRKLYADDIRPEAVLDESITSQWYGEHGGWHKMYVVEIEHIFMK